MLITGHISRDVQKELFTRRAVQRSQKLFMHPTQQAQHTATVTFWGLISRVCFLERGGLYPRSKVSMLFLE